MKSFISQKMLLFLALALASCFAIALVVVRTMATGTPYFRFLVWNLFLA